MGLDAAVRRLSQALICVATIGLLSFAAAGIVGPRHPVFCRDALLYDATILAAAISAVLQTLTLPAHERHGRALMAVGLLSWTIGDLCWELYSHLIGPVPTPSICDILYLAMYPMLFIGLLIYVRPRLRAEDLSLRADGVIVGLGFAAIYCLLMAPVARAATGGVTAVAT